MGYRNIQIILIFYREWEDYVLKLVENKKQLTILTKFRRWWKIRV